MSHAPQPGRPFSSRARAFIPRTTATTACAASWTAVGSRPALGFPSVAVPLRPAVQAEAVLRRGDFVAPVIQEIKRVIVGQDYLIDRLLIGLFCDGHLLIEGVPGLAKTLAVKTLADTIDADFKRIQFTPDLLPADLDGTMIYDPREQTFHPRKGPVFTDILLADEINRAPPKVQSALLEAMQERQVSLGGTTHPLSPMFMVLATQNPIEHEGTYRLPEAHVDRFMLKVVIGYPSMEEERAIMDRQTVEDPVQVRRIATPAAILAARQAVRQVQMDGALKDYIVRLVFATRDPAAYGLPDLEPLIAFGVSPRATIYLSLAARANAFLEARDHVLPDDVKSIAVDVMRHRLIPTYQAEAEEITSEAIVQRVLDKVPLP
ncbi:MAG: MoxR family ATPase [Chloroflexota bacterium]|nr:MoxR family ATPase [Chloroflexota bacterium]